MPHSLNIDKEVQYAIDALTAINAKYLAWQESGKLVSVGEKYAAAPRISDHLHIDLLEAIVCFDDTPTQSLDDLRSAQASDDDGYDGGRFDYYTGQAGERFFA